jgi:hypothetical protein
MLQNCAELVRANLVKADMDGQLEGAHQIESAPDKQAFLRALGRRPACRAGSGRTDCLLFWRVRAQAGIAQFVAPQRPMLQESEGRCEYAIVLPGATMDSDRPLQRVTGSGCLWTGEIPV